MKQKKLLNFFFKNKQKTIIVEFQWNFVVVVVGFIIQLEHWDLMLF